MGKRTPDDKRNAAKSLRNLDGRSADEGATTAGKDFDKSPLAAVCIAAALLEDSMARATSLSPSGFAYVREIFNLVGLHEVDSDDSLFLSRALLQIKPLLGDEAALKKQISNWRARRLLQIT
jgi:hypothetical protein